MVDELTLANRRLRALIEEEIEAGNHVYGTIICPCFAHGNFEFHTGETGRVKLVPYQGKYGLPVIITACITFKDGRFLALNLKTLNLTLIQIVRHEQ